MDVLIAGRLNIDLFAQPVRTPLSQAHSFERALGGFAGNVATATARLGLSTGVISRVGNDGHGEFARHFLTAEGHRRFSDPTDSDWPILSPFLNPGHRIDFRSRTTASPRPRIYSCAASTSTGRLSKPRGRCASAGRHSSKGQVLTRPLLYCVAQPGSACWTSTIALRYGTSLSGTAPRWRKRHRWPTSCSATKRS